MELSDDKNPDINTNDCIWNEQINTTVFLLNELRFLLDYSKRKCPKTTVKINIPLKLSKI